MKAQSQVVQSVLDFAIREINALELQIVKSEDDADDMLWDQARQVVEQLKTVKQRDLAKQWINGRTGDPYTQAHVSYVAAAYRDKSTYQPRPRFRDAYNEIANASKLAVHHSSETPEHYTPAGVIEAVVACLGEIDLDPCSNPGPPNVPARQHYTAADDGLSKPWRGRVFLNPPYGRDIGAWISKVREEWVRGEMTEAIALLPARTDTDWFHTLTADTDDAVICFLYGRLTFLGNTDPAPFPSMLVYFGPNHDHFARTFVNEGSLWQRPASPLEWFVDHN